MLLWNFEIQTNDIIQSSSVDPAVVQKLMNISGVTDVRVSAKVNIF